MTISLKKAVAVISASMMLAACPISAQAATLKTENGIKYILSDSGESKAYTGWVRKSGKKYYYKDGIMKKYCWLCVNGKRTYFLQKDGSMAVGKVIISGKEYEFDKNGRLISAWKVFVNQKELEFDSSEAPFTEGDTLMIPICKTAEALGYKVSFDETGETVTINDEHIRKAILNFPKSPISPVYRFCIVSPHKLITTLISDESLNKNPLIYIIQGTLHNYKYYPT